MTVLVEINLIMASAAVQNVEVIISDAAFGSLQGMLLEHDSFWGSTVKN